MKIIFKSTGEELIYRLAKQKFFQLAEIGANLFMFWLKC